MSKAVILSHPFSGALLAFFDAQLQGGRHATAASYHPYYRTLYGDDFQKWTDISLTLLLLFEHVVIAPADNPMPDHAKYAAGGVYNNPELGLVPSWDDFLKAREGLDESVTQDLQDPVIQATLADVPLTARKQILRDARFEVSLAAAHKAPIIAARGRRRIIERIGQRDLDHQEPQILASSSVRMLEEYLDIVGLLFQTTTIDQLYRLKADAHLREYATAFGTAMVDLPPGPDARRGLLEAIRAATDRTALASRITGGFNVSSLVLSVVGLVPGIGTAFSLGALGATGGAALSKRREIAQKWYEFGPQVRRLVSLDAIRDEVARLNDV